MADMRQASNVGDLHDLNRFVQAQENDYERALSEVRQGRKRSHWMWYIFPQFDGLGFSQTSKRYAIKSVAEAKAYLSHPVLGPRLLECFEAALSVEGQSAYEIFGSPDDMKLKSCATLFASVSPVVIGLRSVARQVLSRRARQQDTPSAKCFRQRHVVLQMWLRVTFWDNQSQQLRLQMHPTDRS